MTFSNFLLILSCFCYQTYVLSYEINNGDETMAMILKKLADMEKELLIVKEENRALKTEVWKLSQDNREFKQTQMKMDRKLETILSEMATEETSTGHITPTRIIKNRPNKRRIYSKETPTNKNVERRDDLLTGSPLQTTPANNNAVGFLAYVANHKENLGIHQTVEFESVVTNVGSSYHPNTSVFIAPTDGLYFFSVSILSFQGEDMETEIVHNGNGVAYTYSGGEQMYGSGSTSAVLQLNANDDVWVRILDVRSVNNGNIRVFADRWSSFCGYKIL